MYHKWGIETSPLQTYISALNFSPACSLIKGLSKIEAPTWIMIKPGIGDKWSPCLLTLDHDRSSVRSVTFSHDSALLASASNETVRIWDVSSGECVHTLDGCCPVSFSHNSSQLASASYNMMDLIWKTDIMVRIWDTDSGQCLQKLEGHGRRINSVAFSHDAARLESRSDDETVRIWDTDSGRCLQTFRGHKDRVRLVAFTRDSTRLASPSDDETVKV